MGSNIIDKPRTGGARDLLGTDKYLESRIRFIKTAQMPTTIAIQGEWGSGKTSMMNQIKLEGLNKQLDYLPILKPQKSLHLKLKMR